MLLTITSTRPPATDLGYLLHKNPARTHSFDLTVGRAHVFFPEASEERCTAALLLDLDPVGMVRMRRGARGEDSPLAGYVNDRPYVASSHMSVAIGRVFGSALGGRCRDRPGLAVEPEPFEARIDVVPCRGGEGLLRRLFEPLGYRVEAVRHPLDETLGWSESPYFTVTLAATCLLKDLLAHIYVLVPVLDDEKHYWVGEDELEKLLRHGEGWLASHPEREVIATRYLKHCTRLVRLAIERLDEGGEADPGAGAEERAAEEAVVEAPLRLADVRLTAVALALKECGARRVLDLGCGEGKLVVRLLDDPAFTEVVGLDVSSRALEVARSRLHLDRLPPSARQRVRLLHGSLAYRDLRLTGFDAAAVVEVIEHLDPARLRAFERVLFECARPRTVVLTTPNREYNVLFESLPAGKLRHRDHRFEWTRAELAAWADRVAGRFGYRVRYAPVGAEAPGVGAPTQMAIFSR